MVQVLQLMVLVLTLTYTHTGTKWNVNKDFDVTGNIIVSGTVDGVDIAEHGRDAVDVTNVTGTTTATKRKQVMEMLPCQKLVAL